MSTATASTLPRNGFHVMSKPIGPICNLDCKYCFYLEKEKLYPDTKRWQMPREVLERYIEQYIAAQPLDEVHFAWQGGEPTLLGVDFFREVVALEQKHAGGKTIHNAVQTNGTLIDDEWAAFLAENKFLVGISIDGPREIAGRTSFARCAVEKPPFVPLVHCIGVRTASRSSRARSSPIPIASP